MCEEPAWSVPALLFLESSCAGEVIVFAVPNGRYRTLIDPSCVLLELRRG